MSEMKYAPDLSRAAELACRCILKLGIDTLPIRPAQVIAKCRNTLLMDYARAAESLGMSLAEFEQKYGAADAFTFRYTLADGHVSYLVCYRAGGNAARLNFTLAHELGHIVLKHHSGQPWEEREADCFAANLLCPAPILTRIRQNHPILYAEELAAMCFITVPAAERIAEESNVYVPKAISDEILERFGEKIPLNCLKKMMPGWHRIR